MVVLLTTSSWNAVSPVPLFSEALHLASVGILCAQTSFDYRELERRASSAPASTYTQTSRALKQTCSQPEIVVLIPFFGASRTCSVSHAMPNSNLPKYIDARENMNTKACFEDALTIL